MQVTTTTKLSIRMAILTVGLVGAFIVGNVSPVPAADGGPILLCPPGDKTCKPDLPPVIS